MTNRSFYTDRTRGQAPRLQEDIPETAWRALAALVESRVEGNWLAKEFPVSCDDGNGIWGTNREHLSNTLEALIPELSWPLDRNAPDTETVLDLIDFVGQRVALPVRERWHDYLRHYELSFNVKKGQSAFCADVEQIFARSGIAYQIDPDMIVCRLGPLEARETIADLDPGFRRRDARRTHPRCAATLPVSSTTGGARRPGETLGRVRTTETLELGYDKKAQVNALLDRVGAGAWRNVLDAEARALTLIGNSMQIRHFETGKEPVPDDAVDYLFTRLATLMHYLLRATGRLA